MVFVLSDPAQGAVNAQKTHTYTQCDADLRIRALTKNGKDFSAFTFLGKRCCVVVEQQRGNAESQQNERRKLGREEGMTEKKDELSSAGWISSLLSALSMLSSPPPCSALIFLPLFLTCGLCCPPQHSISLCITPLCERLINTTA